MQLAVWIRSSGTSEVLSQLAQELWTGTGWGWLDILVIFKNVFNNSFFLSLSLSLSLSFDVLHL